MLRAPYSASLLVWEEAPKADDVRIVVISDRSFDDYHADMGPATKFPGGKAKDEDGGSPFLTACRETREETGLIVPAGYPERFVIRVPHGPSHFKIWFSIMLGECQGQLKLEPTIGSRSITSPPFQRTVRELKKELWPSHRPALLAFEHRLLRGFYRIPA